MQIVSQTPQPLLSRVLLEATTAFDGPTPSNEKAARDIASLLKTEASLVVVKTIRTVFGKRQASVRAVVYNDVTSKSRFEPKTKRMKEAETKAAQEAASQKSGAQAGEASSVPVALESESSPPASGAKGE